MAADSPHPAATKMPMTVQVRRLEFVSPRVYPRRPRALPGRSQRGEGIG
jgi:hypothetical protein